MKPTDEEKRRQAIDAIQQTIRDKPAMGIARFDLGMLYLQMGNRGEAINQYRKLQEIDKRLAQKLLEQIYPLASGLSPGSDNPASE
jgi:tetratricopeptide (TPR) repeat protein